MASAVDICNMALSHIGDDTNVASINPPDGSVAAGNCARFYPIARREMLEMAAWSWAMRRDVLAGVTNPSNVWAYAYTLPSDCIRARRVLQLTYVDVNPIFWPYSGWLTADQVNYFTERGSSDFDVETDANGNSVLLTNEPNAVLMYQRDITDTTKFSGSFTPALSYLLASYLAGPTIKGQAGAQAAGTLRQIATNMALGAAANNANDSAETAEYLPGAIRARS